MSTNTHIIFLDFDGVVVTPRSLVAKVTPDGFDPVALRWVQLLSDRAGAHIVISSAWRTCFDREGLRDLLVRNGFDAPPLHQDWATPVLEDERQAEIDDWLARNPHAKHWLILDDGIGLREDSKHLVHTCMYNGIRFLEMLRCCKPLGLDVRQVAKEAGFRLTEAELGLLGF